MQTTTGWPFDLSRCGRFVFARTLLFTSFLIVGAVAARAQQADVEQAKAQQAGTPETGAQQAGLMRTPDPCAKGHEFATTDCTLTWHGITFYGAYDVGAGWVSHGLPQNPYNYEGSSLVNRNANSSRFLVEPDNLSQTGVGIRGRVKFAEDWFVVFNASTAIDPQSGLLSNASATDIENNGLPRAGYSEAIDG